MTPTTALRLAPETLVDACDLLQAQRFELIGDDVTFEALGGAAGRRWSGRLGDDLVPDGNGFWRIVSAEAWNPLALWAATPAPRTVA
ncbi:hypothetical protein FHX74_002070 [Friedmanniella endophytica]|uniref:Uncharacterized protein n=1 Tax=Microlunatus kandeliicorticis TaxID=1759536 RepID=A0A7W3ISJ7_9ACTN|nr:hypothetical protein [Microlunatus kandeliicorticis]MBA8794451.1 hypothetical protein [Microlunatus kandeliicorticis]